MSIISAHLLELQDHVESARSRCDAASSESCEALVHTETAGEDETLVDDSAAYLLEVAVPECQPQVLPSLKNWTGGHMFIVAPNASASQP